VAGAHVTVDPTEHGADGYTVATFAFSHGCDGSPTTEIAVQIPEEILGVAPSLNPNWEVEKVMEPVDPPATGPHGEEITERVAEVVYTAKEPVADGYRDTFEFSFYAPDLPGETLSFPTIQTCEEGSNDWIQIAEEGEEEPESPAPQIVLVAGEGHGDDGDGTAADGTDAAGDDGADTGSGDGDTASDESAAPADSDGDDDGSDALAIAALAVGALGVVVGAAALVTARKRA